MILLDRRKLPLAYVPSAGPRFEHDSGNRRLASMQSIHSDQHSQRALGWAVLALSVIAIGAFYAAIITG